MAEYCPYERVVSDCDGDIVVMCDCTSECPYKKIVRDCDGDILEICCK